jgi:hypothetical protein
MPASATEMAPSAAEDACFTAEAPISTREDACSAAESASLKGRLAGSPSGENSPAFQGWDMGERNEEVPEGRQNSGIFRTSFVPAGLEPRGPVYPALKGWAIFAEGEPHTAGESAIRADYEGFRLASAVTSATALGSTRAPRVLTSALAGQSEAYGRDDAKENASAARVFREGAEHSTRGACAPLISAGESAIGADYEAFRLASAMTSATALTACS